MWENSRDVLPIFWSNKWKEWAMVVLVLVSLDISMYVANINIISSLYLNNHQIWNKWETYNVRFQLQRYPRWLQRVPRAKLSQIYKANDLSIPKRQDGSFTSGNAEILISLLLLALTSPLLEGYSYKNERFSWSWPVRFLNREARTNGISPVNVRYLYGYTKISSIQVIF